MEFKSGLAMEAENIDFCYILNTKLKLYSSNHLQSKNDFYKIPNSVRKILKHMGIYKRSNKNKNKPLTKTRSGHGNINLVFLNANSKHCNKFLESKDRIENNSIIFLSETMTTKLKQKPAWKNKRAIYVDAKEPTNGKREAENGT